MTLIDEGYDTWLTGREMRNLTIYTQRRHLLEHKGGIVDLKYIQATNDNTYKEGDRIIVKPYDIEILGNIVLKIIDCISRLQFYSNKWLGKIVFLIM